MGPFLRTAIAVLATCLLLDSTEAFFKKKNKGGSDGGSECRTVYDEVWEEKCKTLYNEACKTDYTEQCRMVEERVCNTVNEEECSTVHEKQCKDIPYQKCATRYESQCRTAQECTTHSEQVCKAVPRSICSTVTDKECKMVEERQCRDVVVSEQVGNYVKVDEQVVSTTRIAAEEVDYERTSYVAEPEHTYVQPAEDFHRIVDTSEGTAYRVLDDSDFDLFAVQGAGGKKKKHGVFKRSIRDRLQGHSDSLHSRLHKIRDGLTKKSKKSKKEPEPEFTPYVAVRVAPTVKKVQVQHETRSECRLVPSKRCTDVPRQQCRTESETKCTSVPKEVCQDVEKCHDVPKQDCSTETRQSCHNVPRQQCSLVPRERCNSVPRRSCEHVPREICTNVPSKSCKKLTVSRPREVCDQPIRSSSGGLSSSSSSGGKKH